MKYKTGQRYYSESEPELGLGVVTQLEGKTVQILYPQSSESRTYGIQTAPLKRFSLNVGEDVSSEGVSAIITSVKELDDIFIYVTDKGEFVESVIDADIKINGPLERLFIQNTDGHDFYQQRYKSALATRSYQEFSYKGFLGAKIRYIPHQIFVASQVISLSSPKALLCDEVGLGKTIEALLILHALKQKELVSKVLIVVPDSLKNQWFIEMYKKFSLSSLIYDPLELTPEHLAECEILIASKRDLLENEEIARQSWEMLIIDEAHQIPFAKDELLPNTLKSINAKTYSTLLLSATPEVTGSENLFAQLQMLDPAKFSSFEDFKAKQSNFGEISKLIAEIQTTKTIPKAVANYVLAEEMELAPEKIVQIIVDRFGIGRNFFRNSRDHLQKFEKIFTDRKPHPLPIEIDKKQLSDSKVIKAKADEIIKLISNTSEKIFIICHAKNVVMTLQKEILAHMNCNIALFHSDQSLLERDRQAAYFADPEGAQVLICTEIGSEGRNFEFAHKMVLFDLPKTPDQLEQRIGRLDRIGQNNDIEINIPYIKESFEETLFHWYSDVLGIFYKFSNAGSLFYQENKNELVSLLEKPFDKDSVTSFIEKMQEKFKAFAHEYQTGRDRLHEIKSFNNTIAQDIITKIESFEQSNPLKAYLEDVFNLVGIEFDQLNEHSYFIGPSYNMLIPSYAGLSSEGASYTFDRDYSIKHENIDLLNWEHPLVKTAYDLFLNSNLGNLSIVQTSDMPQNLLFEFIFGLQTSGKFRLNASVYLPYTPLRVLIDVSGQNVTQKMPKKYIDGLNLAAADDALLQQFKNIPKNTVFDLFKKAQTIAVQKQNQFVSKALEACQEQLKTETQRLSFMYKDNTAELAEQSEKIQTKFGNYEQSIKSSQLEISALRVVVGK
tara:strand:- start:241 stop:2919 length:2679 start_codon:yes stop_codon:yes gene_type:complete